MSKKVLIADDDVNILRVLRRLFEGTGYEVVSASDGEEAVDVARRERPDLLVLDINMPRLNGYGVCGRLRQEARMKDLPILFLSARGDTADKLPGFALGGDDYVTKPCDLLELKARVHSLLERSQSYLAANPLTHLPGSPAIEREVGRRLAAKESLALAYVDLDFFKAYNDAYGYEKGDSIIRETASVLTGAVSAHAGPGDMLCHIGGDDFVVISSPERVELIAREAAQAFDRLSPGFHGPLDRDRGYIETTNRLGNRQRFPLVSMSIGIITDKRRPIGSYAEAAGLASEMKRFVKSRADGKSRWAVDRRNGSEKAAGVERTSVFLFTDLLSSTDLFSRLGDEKALDLLERHFRLLKAQTEARGGKVIKTMGDAMMALFASSDQAVAAAIAMQKACSALFARTPGGAGLKLKIGVHQGKAIAVEDSRGLDYFGSAVNVAARLRGESAGGDIVMTEAVYCDFRVQGLLREAGLGGEAFTAGLRGVPEPQALRRLRV